MANHNIINNNSSPGSNFDDELGIPQFNPKTLESTLEKLLASPVCKCKGKHDDNLHVNNDLLNDLINETMILYKSVEGLQKTNAKMLVLLNKLSKPQVATFEIGESSRKGHKLKGIARVDLSDDEMFNGQGIDNETSPHGKAAQVDISKKLGFTPSPKDKDLFKRAKTGQQSGKKRCTPSPKVVGDDGGVDCPRSGGNKVKHTSNGTVLPKFIRCKFRPTLKMRLSKNEAKVCAYAFADSTADIRPLTHHSDILFNMDAEFGLRSDFACLVPGQTVNPQIVTMTAMCLTWNQTHRISKTFWCLPPSFAMDVAKGTNVTELEIKYGMKWMPTVPDLKLIYVPIEDGEHIFLMVIKLDERKVYHLDTHLLSHQVEPRRQIIKKICDKLSQISLSLYDMEVPSCAFPHFDDWEIVEPRGIPQCGHSQNSGLWVCEWMGMQNAFNAHIMSAMDEPLTRMKTGLRLLMGQHNEAKEMLLVDADAYWQSVINERDIQD